MRAAMNENKQWVPLVLIKIRRQCEETMNTLAAFASRGEFAQRLPVDLRDALSVEIAERFVSFPCQIHAHDLGRIDCAIPVCKENGRWCFARYCQVGVATPRRFDCGFNLAAL